MQLFVAWVLISLSVCIAQILLLEGISQTAVDMLVKEGFQVWLHRPPVMPSCRIAYFFHVCICVCVCAQVETQYKITEEELIKKLPDYHALGIRFVCLQHHPCPLHLSTHDFPPSVHLTVRRRK